MAKYLVEAICGRCGLIRQVSKYRKGSTGLCRPCSSSDTGRRTGKINSPFQRTHGMRRSRLYSIWCAMRQRCENPNNPSHKNYGGRGIEICAEWHDFAVFADWSLGNGYKDGLEIDRMDNDKGYTPENCRWVLHADNTRNTRRTKLSKAAAEQIRAFHRSGFKQVDIAEHFGVSPQTVNHVVRGKQWA